MFRPPPPPMIHRILPPAAARGRRIQVVIEPEMIGLFPVTMTAVPVVQPGVNQDELFAADVIGDDLRLAVLRALRLYKPGWSDHRLRETTRGVLIMENWNNDGQRGIRQNVFLKDVTGALLWTMFLDVF